jgi:predicted acylesterase/phospholipase RssA
LTPGLGGGTIGPPSTREEGMPELRADVENGPWPQDPGEVCDLVMKGGVASGVVYPGAILALAKRYRFRNVGGTSAGAIAATVTAAAELGRREGNDGGFERLREVAEAICEPNRVLSLFQPRPETRRVFDLAVRMMDAKAKGVRARNRVIVDALRRAWLPIVLLAVTWTAAVSVAGYALFLWLGWWSALTWPVLLCAALVGMGFLAACAVAFLVVPAGRTLLRTLGSREAGFGLCPGTSQRGFDTPALSAWLHEHIQRCAGRSATDPPLTFADLRSADDDTRSIALQLMTTDVSSGRPVRLPLPDENLLYFDAAEIGKLVPAEVADWMRGEAGEPVEVGGRTLHKVPGERMPVLLATRMSLAVPGLLASVPFYEPREDVRRGYAEHWFSDGAITSNFPVHFFDALLPGHPTLGLDLMGVPDPELGKVVEDASPDPTLRHVYLPAHPTDPEPLRWASIRGFGGFLAQVLDTGLNWRDTMQMEMPGFRERVCHIRLGENEGGLNLSMDEDAVRGLMMRGAYAGESFDAFNFGTHRFTRYLILMQMLEAELKRARERFGYDRTDGDDPRWFRDRLTATLDDDRYPWANARTAEWCAQAREATQAVFDLAAGWGAAEPPPSLGFDRPDQTPTPRPSLRIVPPV